MDDKQEPRGTPVCSYPEGAPDGMCAIATRYLPDRLWRTWCNPTRTHKPRVWFPKAPHCSKWRDGYIVTDCDFMSQSAYPEGS